MKMGNWGINPNASEKEKLKSRWADFMNGENCCGIIDYKTYCEYFDYGMKLLDEMYELGKREGSQATKQEE